METPVTIVVPCYNEEKRLDPEKFIHYLTFRHNSRLLFVDDGSTDGTMEIIDRLKGAFPERVIIEKYEQNKGKAYAVRHGMLKAYEIGGVDFAAFIDADLAIPIDQVDGLIQELKLKKKTIAITSRRLKRVMGNTGIRADLSAWLNDLINFLFFRGDKISDTQCGCKAFAIERIPELFEEPFVSRWLFDIEVLLRAKKKEMLWQQVVEVPLARLNDNSGSKIALFYGFKLLRDLQRIRKVYK